MSDSAGDSHGSSVKSDEKSPNPGKALKQHNHIKSSSHKVKPPSSGMSNNHHANSLSPKPVSSKTSSQSSSSKPKEASNSHSSPSKPLSNSHHGKPLAKPSSGSGSESSSGLHSSSKHSSASSSVKSSSSSKPKEGSNSSHLPKEGHVSSKPRPEGSKPSSHSGSGSVKPSSDKHKDGTPRPKDSSKLSSTPKPSSSHKSSSSVPSSKPKEGSSSVKPKPPSSLSKDPSAKPKEGSSKPKEGSSKPKEGLTKPKDGSSKPKEGSNKPISKPLPSKSSSSSHVSKDKSHSKSLSDSSSSAKEHTDGKSSSSEGEFKKEKPAVNHENRKLHKEGDRVKPKSHGSGNHVAKISIKVEKGKPAEIIKSPVKVKKEPATVEVSSDDQPLDKRLEKAVKKESQRQSSKRPHSDSEDEEPLAARVEKVKKQKTEASSVKKEPKDVKSAKRKHEESEDDYEPPAQEKKKAKHDKKSKDKKKEKGKNKGEKGSKKKTKKEEEAQDVWKWWEEEPHPEGVKWIFLEHKGPVFAPPYEPLPKNVKFYYEGKAMKLSPGAEEVAGFYARMLDHDYTTREVFNKNFFNDWRKEMNEEERKKIAGLEKCNFKEMHQYFLEKAEERRNMSKEEKLAIKTKNEETQQEYGFCSIDGHREKMGNFKIEPPGLFRGRGDHPKQGMHKKRVRPKDVIINCSKDSKIPVAPEGHRWKQVVHDSSVTWLASWNENIQGAIKYVMLNPSSRLKGEKDWAKYEIARKLNKCVDKIRTNYREDFKNKEMRIRQRAVALYFIDKLALRAGNEKEEGESADTVGCCSLRVEHLSLHEEKNGQESVVEFDFLGKDSIRYQNSVAVEKRVFRNLKLFMENKQEGDDLFDRLNTSILNKHLQELMEGLTAKVFRTYNASSTLQNQLDELTVHEDSIPNKILSYNRANRAVAILCNHQRAAPKTFDKQMENLQTKIKAKHEAVRKARKEFKSMKNEYKSSRNDKMRAALERKKTQVDRLEEQLTKLEVSATDKEENKEIALGTSKLNYLDPRISVAWTKKWEVPIEKIYNRTQRDKFRWAIDMAGPDFVF